MKAQIDLPYSRQWAEYYEKNPTTENQKKLDRIVLMSHLACRKELLAGYPNFHDNDTDQSDLPLRNLLQKSNLSLPGISDVGSATWCPYFVGGMFGAIDAGYNAEGIDCDDRILYLSEKSRRFMRVIGSLNSLGAQYLHSQLDKGSLQPKILKIESLSMIDAQTLADNLEVVIVSALPLPGYKYGHVAILSPMIHLTPDFTINDMWIYQAGAVNGSFPLTKIFNSANGMQLLKFFIIKE